MEKRGYAKACGFCARRKIKCNGASPCDSCEKRGRGGSCAAAGRPSRSSRTRTRTRTPARRSASVSTACVPSVSTACVPPLSTAAPTAATATGKPPPSQLGANALPLFVSSAAHRSQIPIAHLHDIRPALGLQNAALQYPFPATRSEIHGWQSPLPFTHAHVLKFSQVYESVLSPVLPFIPTHEALEGLVMAFLERMASDEARITPPADAPSPPADHGQTSLLCAILACGAQVSDDSLSQRVEASRAFAQYAFAFARLANFLLRPKPSTLQAMLLLSFFLQNDGQADAAWSLLGTVSRLAMSAGVHRVLSTGVESHDTPGQDEIWPMIKAQDCILSLCFDRPPMAYSPRTELEGRQESPTGAQLHHESMEGLFSLCHRWLAESEASRRSAATICEYIDCIDSVDDVSHASRVSMSRPGRRTLIERMTLQLYASYFRAAVCRPALTKTSILQDTSAAETIRQHAASSTERTMLAFIELSKLTRLPLRTWSMIHAGISSAIMVEFVDVASELPRLRQTQKAFLALLARSYQDSTLDGSSDRPAWLSTSHLSYLRALQDLSRERESQGVGVPDESNSNNDSFPAEPGDPEDANEQYSLYTHAKRNLASISGGEGQLLEPDSFDWSLISVDDALLDFDFEIPHLGF